MKIAKKIILVIFLMVTIPILTSAIALLLLSAFMEDCTTKQTIKPNHLKRLFKTNNCPGCNLGDADLSRVNLEGADLSKAELVKAVLDGANLQKANLSEAQLSWHEIDDDDEWGFNGKCDVEFAASLEKVNLSEANLTEANLRDVNLKEANLYYANLTNANLREANLEGTDLRFAHLEAANLEEVNLKGADLGFAHLEEANFRGVDLREADLQKVTFSDKLTKWEGAKYNKNTKFPEGFSPTDKGMILIPSKQR